MVNDITIPVELVNDINIPSEIVVNDITIPVELDVIKENNENNENNEIKYDNIDLMHSSGLDKEDKEDRMKKLLTNMEQKYNKNEEVNVIKDANIREKKIELIDPKLDKKKDVPNYSFTNLYPTMKNNENIPVINENIPVINENIPVIKENIPVINDVKKEIVTITNDNDIDETSTLVNFFNDMKQIAEDKGIKVDTSENKNFTLFEDASEVEKVL